MDIKSYLADPNVSDVEKSLQFEIWKDDLSRQKEKARDTINMLTNEESGSKYLAAGAFIPSFALISQLPFFMSNLSKTGKLVAATSIISLLIAGFSLIVFTAFYITVQKSKVQKFLSEFNGSDTYSVELNVTKSRTAIVRIIFVLYLLGFGSLIYLVSALLLGF